jgi:hypothetical protein
MFAVSPTDILLLEWRFFWLGVVRLGVLDSIDSSIHSRYACRLDSTRMRFFDGG